MLFIFVFLEKIILINLSKSYFLYIFLSGIFFCSLKYKLHSLLIICIATFYDIIINSTLGWSALFILIFIFIILKLTDFININSFHVKFIIYIIFINLYNLYLLMLTNFNIINISVFRFAPYIIPQLIIQLILFIVFSNLQNKF